MSLNRKTLTVQAAAKRIGCSPRTLYRWMARGELAFERRKDGRRIVHVEALLNAAEMYLPRRHVDETRVEDAGYFADALQNIQRQLEHQETLLRAIVELYRPDSLEGIHRKREALDQLNQLSKRP